MAVNNFPGCIFLEIEEGVGSSEKVRGEERIGTRIHTEVSYRHNSAQKVWGGGRGGGGGGGGGSNDRPISINTELSQFCTGLSLPLVNFWSNCLVKFCMRAA